MNTVDHRYFLKYKNIHYGDTVILFATGETLNDFNDNLENNAKRIGINGAIILPNIHKSIDYFIWAGDTDIPQHPQPGFYSILKSACGLRDSVDIFVCCYTDNKVIHPTVNYESQLHPDIAKRLNFNIFNQTATDDLHRELDQYPLDGSTAALQAMQLALYMGFKRIILVGFDCSGHHAYKNLINGDVCDWYSGDGKINDNLINRWIFFKQYLHKYYQDVEVLVHKPIGLKDIFPEYHNN